MVQFSRSWFKWSPVPGRIRIEVFWGRLSVRKAISGLVSIVFIRFNPGLALIAFRTTGPWTIEMHDERNKTQIKYGCHTLEMDMQTFSDLRIIFVRVKVFQ